ncbi:MAG: cytidine deaminase [Oscillospiraceae bacterium]|nr:cytidine deaminase [Oscillospiraceae bacterium]MDE7094064.1 cytidine deaminase [Oscillospiraceae bacterium]
MSEKFEKSELLKKAREAQQYAYCKYSEFPVGAALLTESGEIYTGCNIENASYSLGICAERVAFAKAISDGHHKFKAIAIIGGIHTEKNCPPCGACRQFMAEFCDDEFKIYLAEKTVRLKQLFPERFVL